MTGDEALARIQRADAKRTGRTAATAVAGAGPDRSDRRQETPPCVHLGPATGETVPCTCKHKPPLEVHVCAIYGECTLKKQSAVLPCCDNGRGERCLRYSTR